MLIRMKTSSFARPTRGSSIAVLFVVAILASACSSTVGNSGRKGTGGDPSGGNGFGHPVTPLTGSSTYAVGTVRSTGDAAGCLPGDKCKGFEVDCPGTGGPARGSLDVVDPVGQPRGLLVFLSGGGGNKLWSESAKLDLQFSSSKQQSEDPAAARLAADALRTFRDHGYMTVQVVWRAGWLSAPKGNPVGPAHLACRSASLFRWLHDTYYQPMGVNPAPLQCGFCLTGNSGGASQIAYSLAFYGLGDIVDAVVESGGPPHAALDRACLNRPGYQYSKGLDGVLDISYGFYKPQRGPCVLHDPTWAATWKRDGADTGGSSYSYPNTRVLLVLGQLDETQVGPHQMAYLTKLQDAGSPHVVQVTIPNMTHAITASQDGLGRITDWFLSAG